MSGTNAVRFSHTCLTVAALVLLLAACSKSTTPVSKPVSKGDAVVPTPSSSCSPGPDLTATTQTSSYVVVANVGDPVPMYSKKQAAAQNPTSGDIMLGGTMMPDGTMSAGDMSGDTDMSMGSSASMGMPDEQHLAVRICSADSGDVVADAAPTISIADKTVGGPPEKIAVAVMQGVGEGPSDIHYGNEVSMPAGHDFEIKVGLNGETGTLVVSRP